MISDFEKKRKAYKPAVISAFRHSLDNTVVKEKNGVIEFANAKSGCENAIRNICVVLSGGPAAGGHNVICGLYDTIVKSKRNTVLYGVISGPAGLVDGNFKVIDKNLIDRYKNHGGFDMLGTGRTKLNKKEQFDSIIGVCKEKDINVIVVIGGDDSNTNAAIMAEYFESVGADIIVIGVPKTIDGDLKNENIEITFGFDTAVRTYSETIGNIANDAVSCHKYYHYVRLMGRKASHIALECALQCHPNITLIGEEIRATHMTLDDIADYIAGVIKKRRENHKNYGVILVPEGIIEYIDSISSLISEINAIYGDNPQFTKSEIVERLSPEGTKAFMSMPANYQDQLLIGRDSHGNVQVSNIESEKIIAQKVGERLHDGYYVYQTHFLGYEGRCAFPTNFDATYTYNLGIAAYLLAMYRKTGYICFVKGMSKKVRCWKAGGMKLANMITVEVRNGKESRVIEKAEVDLKSEAFKYFKSIRNNIAVEDDYIYPGPIQFDGKEVDPPVSLKLNSKK